MERASIIVACLNGASTLREALDSLAGQNGEIDCEIILADNGSTDGSQEIFARWAERHPEYRSRVLDCSGSRGKAYCLNTAIPKSSGDYILFLDSDDAVAPGWLAAMYAALKEYPLVAARLEHTRLNTPEVRAVRTQHPLQLEPLWLPHHPFCTHSGGAALGFHRSVFDELGGFDTEFLALEDTDFCIRAYLAGYRIKFVTDAHYCYRFRQSIADIERQSYAYAKYSALLRKCYDTTGTGQWALLPWARTVASFFYYSIRHRILLMRKDVDPTSLGKSASRLGTARGNLHGAIEFRTAPLRRPVSDFLQPVRRALGIAFSGLFPTITRVRTTEKVMALTFDDGPDPVWTPLMLDTLKRLGVTATFFLIGSRAIQFPDLVEQIKSEGHEIGNHSWSHSSLPTLSSEQVAPEIVRTEGVLAPYGSKLMRPPYGDQTHSTWRAVRKLGYRVVLWNISGGDWNWSDAEAIAQRIVSRAAPGAIVLLHDSLQSYGDESFRDRSATLAAVELCVERLPDYRFTTVTDLLDKGRPVHRFWVKRSEQGYLAALTYDEPPVLSERPTGPNSEDPTFWGVPVGK